LRFHAAGGADFLGNGFVRQFRGLDGERGFGVRFAVRPHLCDGIAVGDCARWAGSKAGQLVFARGLDLPSGKLRGKRCFLRAVEAHFDAFQHFAADRDQPVADVAKPAERHERKEQGGFTPAGGVDTHIDDGCAVLQRVPFAIQLPEMRKNPFLD